MNTQSTFPTLALVASVLFLCILGEFVVGKIGLPKIFGSLDRQGVPANGIRIRTIGYFAAASLVSGLLSALAVVSGWSEIVYQLDFADRLVGFAFMLAVVVGVSWRLPAKKFERRRSSSDQSLYAKRTLHRHVLKILRSRLDANCTLRDSVVTTRSRDHGTLLANLFKKSE